MSITSDRKYAKVATVLLIISIVLIALFIPHKSNMKSITIYHAGSLSYYFSSVEKEYESMKDIDIRRTIGGSNYLYRQISDLGKRPNIYASADAKLVDSLVKKGLAKYSIRFATTRMVIAYTSKSKYSDEINSTNWYEILSKDDVVIGISNPSTDPCGYRSCMVVLLAEHYYNKTFFESIIPSKTGIRKVDNESIVCESILQKTNKLFVRPKMVELFSYLEYHEIDYIFTYECEAKVKSRDGIYYLPLPDEINLGEHKIDYRARITLFPNTEKEQKIEANPIEYGITCIDESSDAVSFLKYMLSETDEILNESGLSPVTPPVCSEWEKLPSELKEVVGH